MTQIEKLGGNSEHMLEKRALPGNAAIMRRAWSDADGRTRRRAIILMLLMLVNMALEMVGIGAVLPVVALLAGDGTIAGPWIAGVLESAQRATGGANLIPIAMAAIVVFFALKGLFQAFVAARTAAFTFDSQVSLSRRLLATYLHQPYGFHLARNSSHLVSAVNNEARDAASAINVILSVVAEMLILAGLGLLLLLVAPTAGLVIAGLGGIIGYIILRLTQAGMARQGARFRAEHALKMQMLQQALGSVKELLLLGRQENMLDRFDTHSSAQADAGRRQSSLSALPRLWLEFLAVLGLATLVISLHRAGEQAIMPLVGLFAAAAFRAVPSISRIVSGVQSFSYFAPSLGHVLDELARPMAAPQRAAAPLPFARSIELRDVAFRYVPDYPLVLNALTLTIEQGTIVGVIGASGAGKSSLIDIITGLLPPTAGQVLVDGAPITSNLAGWQRQIGYVPQTLFLTDDSLRRNIALGVPDEEIDDAAVLRAIDLAQIGALVSSLPQGLDTMMGDRGQRLSGGQRQRVAIARALYHGPRLIIMDEGTSALDAETEADIVRTLHRLRGPMTILVATHRMAVLDGCDAVVRLGAGKAEVAA